MKITVGKSKRIMASESDGNYDKSFKAKGTTYYIEMLSGAGNYVAKWWDSSDNGLGYNNKGWVAIEGKNYRALNNISDVSSDNVMDLLGVISDYDRKPGKPIQDRIKREVAKLIDFDAINSACGKKSVKASRRPVKAARTLDIYTWEELTPEQQDYVIQNWSDMHKLAEVIYDWYNDDIMFAYQDEKQYIADKYANQYGLSINPDKLYWQSNSHGPYPEWDLSQVFDEYQLNDGTEIYFYGRGLDVEAETDSWGEEVESPEIDEVVGHAQEYIDEMWKYINDVCQAYPDDEWVEGTFESNPDAFEFIITDSGEVKYY